MVSRHLDLGCGSMPRNSYGAEELFGVDLRHDPEIPHVRRADLATQAIPFDDNSFSSVSAYDFLEHVPRVLPSPHGAGTRFPFVELMNEIWRVLLPGGRLYAVTPAYPSAAAFHDPTHVNIISSRTHRYFTRPGLLASMYGFGGDFELIRAHWAKSGPTDLYIRPPTGFAGKLQCGYRAWRARNGGTAHMVWEFRAIKSEALSSG